MASVSTEFCIGASCEEVALNSSDQEAWGTINVNNNLAINSSTGTFFPNSTPEVMQEPIPWADTIARIAMYSQLVISPVGLVLNLLCFIVFVKSNTARTATGIHLTFLAIADGVVLLGSYLYLPEQWTRYIGFPNFRNWNSFSCKLSLYTLNLGFLWSGLLLASTTVERFLSVSFPLKVQSWGLYKISKILMIVYLVGSLAVCSYSIFCSDFVPLEDGVNMCTEIQKGITAKICYIGETIVNIVLSNMVCVVLIVTFTVMISIRLFKYKNRRSELGHGGDSGKEFQITLMLVIVATLFLILRIPEMIVFQIVYFFSTLNMMNPTLNNLYAVYPIFVILLVLNHSINFFIYMAFLKNFRHTFKVLCKFKKSGTMQ